MPIPEHVKRQAMDAVSHRETTEFMRLHGYRREPVSMIAEPQSAAPAQRGLLNDSVKKQAMDALRHRETSAHIHLLEDSGSVFAPTTPSRASAYAADRVAELHQSGASIESAHRQITQDGFARLYE